MELTLLQGSSKGHEQLTSFHLVGFPLEVEEARVLVTRCGIPQTESPMVAVGSTLISGAFCNSEIRVETIPLGGVTSLQELGWELGKKGRGRGNWLVKWARNCSSIPSRNPSLNEREGMSPMRFSLPGQWVQSAGNQLVDAKAVKHLLGEWGFSSTGVPGNLSHCCWGVVREVMGRYPCNLAIQQVV
jgi:hypothetical protein